MLTISAIETELHCVVSFLAPKEFVRWTCTNKEVNQHEANLWWLRTHLQPFTSNFDKIMRKAGLKMLWRHYKSLNKWISKSSNTIMNSRDFPTTYFDRTAVAKASVMRAISSGCCERVNRALQYADPSLKADKYVVLKAVSQWGYALRYADPSLKADKEVVMAAAVARSGRASCYADLIKHIE